MTQSDTQRTRGNLPSLLSAFIGREQEMEQVEQLLLSHRLVTIAGPGGAGKTRLALQLASKLQAGFEDGIWLVELASLSDATLIEQTVASCLDIREQTGKPFIETLVSHLASLEILLILDNCEHLVTACAQFAETVLRRCPRLKILVTSREVLGIDGEVVWNIPSLSLPESQPWKSPSAAQTAIEVYKQSEAVQLFLDRAGRIIHGFDLNVENGAWIAEICRQLDGMPLAIELAATRVRAMSVEQIAQRLDDRFRLLIGGSRTAEPRQQTLAATLDWSYMLLSEAEQKVLQRLSVFSGGCTIEAAQAICSSGETVDEDVLNEIYRLVEKSLVVVDRFEGGKTRCRLLESIRQYAQSKLIESGEGGEISDRHLKYYVQWAEKTENYLIGSEQLYWLERYEMEHDNVRAALEWGQSVPEGGLLCLRLAAAMGHFWRLHNYISEGRLHFKTALANHDALQPTLHRAHALYSAYVLAFYQSDYPVVRELAEEALSIANSLGSSGRLEAANALEMLAEVASETGDYSTAPKLYEQALAVYREVGHLVGIGDTLKMLGYSAMRNGEYEHAQNYLEEALVVCRQAGDLRHISSTLLGLSDLAIRRGHFERAGVLLKESLQITQPLGQNWGVAAILGAMGWLALCRGEFKEMKKFLQESLRLRIESGDVGGIAWCLEKLAEAACRENQYENSSIILGCAAALRKPINSVMDHIDQPNYERIISDLRSALGPETFTAAWAEGQTLPLEQVVELALAEPESTKNESKYKDEFGGLTKRELEAALLISKGKSNREIAEAMTVGVKTVETYVTRILNKLGFDSRVQIATWVLENGLDKYEKGN